VVDFWNGKAENKKIATDSGAFGRKALLQLIFKYFPACESVD
jgi:hypothetical protein